jgi:hypothetical protein
MRRKRSKPLSKRNNRQSKRKKEPLLRRLTRMKLRELNLNPYSKSNKRPKRTLKKIKRFQARKVRTKRRRKM